MDNFKPVIAILLLICCLAFADTTYISKKLNHSKILSLYKNQAKILGFALEERGNYLSVIDVIKGTPADKAGILNSDIVVSLNNMEVSDMDNFKRALDNVEREQLVVLGVIRNHEKKIRYIAMNPKKLRSY